MTTSMSFARASIMGATCFRVLGLIDSNILPRTHATPPSPIIARPNSPRPRMVCGLANFAATTAIANAAAPANMFIPINAKNSRDTFLSGSFPSAAFTTSIIIRLICPRPYMAPTKSTYIRANFAMPFRDVASAALPAAASPASAIPMATITAAAASTSFGSRPLTISRTT